MQCPILFQTGAIARYPMGRKPAFETLLNVFADHSTQSASILANPLSSWALNLAMLRDDEAQDWLEFIETAKGQGTLFTFIDPWDNLLTYTEEFENAIWNKNADLFAGKNYLLWSGDVTHAPWTTNFSVVAAPTLTANATAAPDGTISAAQVVYPSTGAAQYSGVIQITSMPKTKSQTVTASVFLKATAPVTITLIIEDSIGGSATTLDVSVTTSWQRFSITWTLGAGVNEGTIDFQIRNSASQATKTIFAWGAQLEYGDVPSDYTKTSASAVELKIADPFWLAAPSSAPGASFGLNSAFQKRGRQLVCTQNAPVFLVQIMPFSPGGNGSYRTQGMAHTGSVYFKRQSTTVPTLSFGIQDSIDGIGGASYEQFDLPITLTPSWQRAVQTARFSPGNSALGFALYVAIRSVGTCYAFGTQAEASGVVNKYKHNLATGGVHTKCRFPDVANHSVDGFDLNTLQEIIIQEYAG